MTQAEAGAPTAQPHRHIHYFHGFDPASVARYRRIFQAASARLGVEIEDLAEGTGWLARRGEVLTAFHHARYEDLVRAWQGGPLWKRVARGLLSLAFYLGDGALGRMARLGSRNLGLALSPLVVIIAVPLCALVIGGAIGGATAVIVALIVSLIVLALCLPALYLHLVLDLFAYMRVLAHGRGPVWQAYADRIGMIAGTIRPGPAETLLVGHSLGGITALLTMERLLDLWPAGRPLSLLTLGSTHGTVLVQKGAGRDRLAAAIRRIAADPRVTWVDVSAPRDAFCLPLLDPLVLTGADPGAESPLVISARLARAPRIPGDRRTVFAAMRRHMGYLLAPVDGSGFDFADTTTGPETLHARFADRNPSPRARMWQG